ncbi:unnamed protein product [Phaedon cochleariae]|uniref:Equilibrative nucleoside transporter n=1 Tax=Phaedon cochleariae TaxID=80249 RepID=A0A9P0DNK9_PHACE|nr:unnamed protein product [Phaedon cochleariae]
MGIVVPLENLAESKVIRKQDSNNETKEIGPDDKYYIIYTIMMLFGIMHLLPISFFATANDYWMHKFRNTSLPTIDPRFRSSLQSNFESGSTIAQTVPTVICMVLSTMFAYKIRLRTRVLVSLIVLASCLALATVFIKIDTDAWQIGFFAFTMTILAIMNGILALFQVSTLALLSKFPENYMKTFLVGQGVGGIFSSGLQVVALILGTSSEASAMIYFLIGTLMALVTLILFYVTKHLNFYQYHIGSSLEEVKRDLISLSEVRDIAGKIWSSLVITMAAALAYVPTHPAIAALVASEHRGDHTPWTEKYFVAVITFLFSDICCLVGRILASTLKRRPSDISLAAIAILRMIIFPPLFMFCNALPRSHLSVWFPHDWQYIIILGSFMISSGYLFNIAFLNVIRLAPENQENAYLIMQTCIGVVGAIFSPLGVLCVHLL